MRIALGTILRRLASGINGLATRIDPGFARRREADAAAFLVSRGFLGQEEAGQRFGVSPEAVERWRQSQVRRAVAGSGAAKGPR